MERRKSARLQNQTVEGQVRQYLAESEEARPEFSTSFGGIVRALTTLMKLDDVSYFSLEEFAGIRASAIKTLKVADEVIYSKTRPSMTIPAIFWFEFTPKSLPPDLDFERPPLSYDSRTLEPWNIEAAERHQSNAPDLSENRPRCSKISNRSWKHNNREVYTNTLFTSSDILRRGVTLKGMVELLQKVIKSVEAIKALFPKLSDLMDAMLEDFTKTQKILYPKELPSMCWEIDGEMATPSIRLDTDWLFLQNYFSVLDRRTIDNKPVMPYCEGMQWVGNIGFMLDDIYEGMRKSDLFGEDGELTDSRRPNAVRTFNSVCGGIFMRRTEFQCLYISLGQAPEVTLFNELELLDSELIETGDDDRIELRVKPGSIADVDSEKLVVVMDAMNILTRVFEEYIVHNLSLANIQAQLHHGSQSEFDEWVPYPWGQWWLMETDQGRAWLSGPAGRWWLSSSQQGNKWLDSERGLEWLNSDASDAFLASAQGDSWYKLGDSEGAPHRACRKNLSESLPCRPRPEDLEIRPINRSAWYYTFCDIQDNMLYYQFPRAYKLVQKKERVEEIATIEDPTWKGKGVA
ncbi:hypothetical protein F5Y16DRAFT_394863 [Xylariaceae sp. FL0255]|nr:hypothetical protein F5Y16DRAFT_394863 [Xylariaceae sp. FL0255]